MGVLLRIHRSLATECSSSGIIRRPQNCGHFDPAWLGSELRSELERTDTMEQLDGHSGVMDEWNRAIRYYSGEAYYVLYSCGVNGRDDSGSDDDIALLYEKRFGTFRKCVDLLNQR